MYNSKFGVSAMVLISCVDKTHTHTTENVILGFRGPQNEISQFRKFYQKTILPLLCMLEKVKIVIRVKCSLV